MNKVFILLFLISILGSCGNDSSQLTLPEQYEGPILEVDNMKTIFSDSAQIKIRLIAKKEMDFENGDKEFPEGVFIEFYEDGKITSTLKANQGSYEKKTDLYTGIGDVIVKNLQDNQQLNTEELHWAPKNETIFTEKFVRIESESGISMGEGLTAHQDLKTYTILRPTGDVYSANEN